MLSKLKVEEYSLWRKVVSITVYVRKGPFARIKSRRHESSNKLASDYEPQVSIAKAKSSMVIVSSSAKEHDL